MTASIDSSSPSEPAVSTPRRQFLGQLAVVAAAAAAACTPALSSAGPPGPTPEPAGASARRVPPLPPLEFDDAWASRLTGRYRAVFDSPTIDDGTGIFNAVVYMQGFETMYKIGDADVNAVLVVRHKAVPMALDDSIWRRYALGKYTGVKDPATDRWSARNPYWRSASGNGEDAAYTLEGLQQRGAVLLACALATQGLASILAERTRQAPGLVFDEFRRHLLPGFELQPSGIFAIMRAQDAGCHYMRST